MDLGLEIGRHRLDDPGTKPAALRGPGDVETDPVILDDKADARFVLALQEDPDFAGGIFRIGVFRSG